MRGVMIWLVFCLFAVVRAERGPSNAEMEKRLKIVVEGLSRIVNTDGMEGSSVVDTFQPMIDKVDQLLKEVDQNKISEQEKSKKLSEMMHTVAGWRKELNKQETDLNNDDDAQNASLLIAVLNNKKDKPMEEQMKVLTAPDFSHLAVVKEILAKKDNKTPLVMQVGAWLDKHPIPVSKPKTLPKGPMAGILEHLEERMSILRAHRRLAEKREAKRQEAFQNMLTQKQWTKEQKLQLKFMSGSQHRAFEKTQAMEKIELDQLNKAVRAIKHGDMKGLELARDALTAHMERMVKAQKAKSGNFLHLMQMSTTLLSPGDFSCPYCGAQCIEKCRADGKSYVNCLSFCVSFDAKSK